MGKVDINGKNISKHECANSPPCHNKSPMVTLEYLHYPHEEGGLNLLDIKARNEAIEIMWMKEYLNLSPSRLTWAKITDIAIDAVAPQTNLGPARLNTFLQTWMPETRGERARKLNQDTTRMLKVVRMHKVSFEAIRLSKKLRNKMPAWYQIGAVNRSMNSKAMKCSILKHNALTIEDLMKVSEQLREVPPNQQHRNNNFCNCQACRTNNERNCTHPHKCAEEASKRIHLTILRLNPLHNEPQDTRLSLTHRRKEQNSRAREEGSTVTFDPTLTSKDNINECF